MEGRVEDDGVLEQASYYGSLLPGAWPFGARSAGEAPAAAAGPAIAQAVYNAIGIWVDMPMTPENVVITLERAKSAA